MVMKCSTAGLRRGDKVEVVRTLGEMVFVLDEHGREHIVLEGDLEAA